MRWYAPLFEWIAAATLLAFAIVIVVRWLTRRPVRDPSCGKCGYNVTGLAGEICPECGANLTEVGVRMPGDRRPTGRVMRGVLWTMLVGAVAMLAVPRLDAMLPYPRILTVSEMLRSPRSRAYESITINGQTTSRDTAVLSLRSLQLTLTKLGGETSVMAVDLAERRGSYVGADGKRRECDMSITGGADVKSLRAWFAMAQVNTDATVVQKEIAEVALALQDSANFANRQAQGIQFWSSTNSASTGFLFGSTRTANSIGPAPDPWRKVIVIGPWAGLWLAGLVVIALLRPRLRTQPIEPTTIESTNPPEPRNPPNPMETAR